MKIEKNLKLTMLFEFYGKLLTERQQEIFISYYFNDISLGELSNIYNISRQAVRDCVLKAEKSLTEFESKLGIYRKFENMQSVLNGLNLSNEQINNILQVWEG